MNNAIIPAAHILFIRDDTEILMLRRFNTGFEDGNYSIPAGRVEQGESALQASVREAYEETGLIIKLQDLKMVHIMYRYPKKDGVERIYFFAQATSWQGNPRNTEPDKCDDLNWFRLDNLPTNTIQTLRFTLAEIAAGRFYSEYGWG